MCACVCERTRITITIIKQKTKTNTCEGMEDVRQKLKGRCVFVCVCVYIGEGMEDVRQKLKGRTSILIGQSGVGKSSLLNTLVPGAAMRVIHLSLILFVRRSRPCWPSFVFCALRVFCVCSTCVLLVFCVCSACVLLGFCVCSACVLLGFCLCSACVLRVSRTLTPFACGHRWERCRRWVLAPTPPPTLRCTNFPLVAYV